MTAKYAWVQKITVSLQGLRHFVHVYVEFLIGDKLSFVAQNQETSARQPRVHSAKRCSRELSSYIEQFL
jgi:hypothetical protein